MTRSEMLERKRREEELYNAIILLGGALTGLLVGLGFLV